MKKNFENYAVTEDLTYYASGVAEIFDGKVSVIVNKVLDVDYDHTYVNGKLIKHLEDSILRDIEIVSCIKPVNEVLNSVFGNEY